jgi:hypothetical protein
MIGERFLAAFSQAIAPRNNVIGNPTAHLSHLTFAPCCGMMHEG